MVMTFWQAAPWEEDGHAADNLQGVPLVADSLNEWGIVVLGGSSGRTDVQRASLFASLGITSLALRWFGGKGQIPGICEVPLETFVSAIDEHRQRGCQHIAFVGTCKGAEAALLVSARDDRIEVVVAISPTSVVWGNIEPGSNGIAWPERSSWTWKNEPRRIVLFARPGHDTVPLRGTNFCLQGDQRVAEPP